MAAPRLERLVVSVRMCEIEVIRGAGVLCCAGLGSCVAAIGFDPSTAVGGMAHVMLPQAFNDLVDARPARFANLALPALIARMESAGAKTENLQFALVGGAKVLKLSTESQLNIGERNTQGLLRAIEAGEHRLIAQDVFGVDGRTVTLSIPDGRVLVRTMAGPERLLCTFGA
jgi:chemotaxis protein CheD